MAENKQGFNLGGCVVWAVSNFAFVLGLILMFSRTVDLIKPFAPQEFMGFTGVADWYAFAVGVMIEGTLVAMKFALGSPKNAVEWISNVVLILVPFGISAAAQVIDGFVISETLSAQTPNFQLFVAWFVPSIPTIIVAVLLVQSVMSSAPPGMFSQQFTEASEAIGSTGQRPAFKIKKPGWFNRGGKKKKETVISKDENFTKRKA